MVAPSLDHSAFHRAGGACHARHLGRTRAAMSGTSDTRSKQRSRTLTFAAFAALNYSRILIGAGFRGSKKMPAPQSAIRRRQWRVRTETLTAQPGAAAMAPPPCQLDGPRQAWCWWAPRPRGSAFGFLPGDVLGQHQGSSPPERRCLAPKLRVVCPTPDSWRAKFSQAQPHQLQNLFGLGGRRAGDAGEKQLVMVRESAIEQRPTLWSANIVLHREGKGEASVCPCF